jgi:hypothetical protein
MWQPLLRQGYQITLSVAKPGDLVEIDGSHLV